ncbi:MAG: phosphoribosylglycinamide formyltransferase [Planctomycetaceae bacterium]
MGGRVAVLVSGSGTNLQALLDDPAVGTRVVLVVSDRADAYALERARAREVATKVLEPASFPDRAAHDQAVLAALRAADVDVVVLAGYLRLLAKAVLDAYPNRVLNVHPALLPAFPGTHGVADALAYGVKVTGVTVHLVDEGLDTGPVVLQEAIEVRRDDTWATVEPRIHALEHRLLPRAVRALLDGRLVVEGRHAWIEGE